MADLKDLSLNRQIDRLAQHVIRARLFLDLWFYFEEHESRKKILPTMQEYGEFFRFAPHAFFVTYVVYIAGVFEQRNDTINFSAVVKQMRGGSDSVVDEDAIGSLLSTAEPIAKKATILRSNAVAHRTAKMSYNEVFELAEVTPSKLRELTEIALQICNLLLTARKLPNQHFSSLPKQAAEEMMMALAG